VKSQYSKQPFFKELITADFMLKAQQIIDWVSAGNLPPKIRNSSFGHNLETLIKRRAVNEKNIAVIVPAAPFYNNAMLIAQSQDFASVYQGMKGEKIERDLIVRKIIPIETMYGDQYITIMHDTSGNVYKWKTASRAPAVLNEVYKAKMTVKDHENYQDVSQTSVLRVKFPDLDLVGKLSCTMPIKEFTKNLSKISNPHIKIIDNGIDLPLDRYLCRHKFFDHIEKLHAYLAHEGVDINSALERNNLMADIHNYAADYRDENEEVFEKLIDLLQEKTDADVSGLRVRSMLSCS
jgi:hypothetical protein